MHRLTLVIRVDNFLGHRFYAKSHNNNLRRLHNQQKVSTWSGWYKNQP